MNARAVGDTLRSMRRLRTSLTFLAEHRWAGVGLALLVELCLLVGLALAPTAAVIGIPAAVAVAIAGTVAVVFGVVDGAVLAFVGALVFALLGGWGAGKLVALAVWPGVVTAAGVFARRVERRRVALRQIVSAQERERRLLALELHDESAQALAGALMKLRAAGHAGDAGSATAAEDARDLITDTIRGLRALAVDLSPKVLADYGLAPALERLAASVSERAGIEIGVTSRWDGRASEEAELALFRIVQTALAASVERGAQKCRITLDSDGSEIVITVQDDGRRDDGVPAASLDGFDEHLRLLGGKLSVVHPPRGGSEVRAELPAPMP